MTTAEIIDRDGKRRTARKGEVLKDGETLRVPFALMDAQQREVALAARRLTDASLHKPGFRGGATSTAALDAYTDAGETLRNAWRNPDAVAAPPVTKPQATGDARESAWLEQGRALKDAWRSAA